MIRETLIARVTRRGVIITLRILGHHFTTGTSKAQGINISFLFHLNLEYLGNTYPTEHEGSEPERFLFLGMCMVPMREKPNSSIPSAEYMGISQRT